MLFNFLKTKIKYTRKLPERQFLIVYLIFSLFLFIIFSFIFIKILNSIALIKNLIIKIDFWIANFVQNIRSEILTKFFKAITYLGEWKWIFVAILILVITFIIKKYWQHLILLIAATLGSEIFIYSIKHLIKRTRPSFLSIILENDFSFPSGHSLIAISFYGILTYFLSQKFYKKWQKIIIWTSVGFLIIMISFSRIYLGVHWFSDVIAGIIAGLIWLIIIIKVFRK